MLNAFKSNYKQDFKQSLARLVNKVIELDKIRKTLHKGIKDLLGKEILDLTQVQAYAKLVQTRNRSVMILKFLIDRLRIIRGSDGDSEDSLRCIIKGKGWRRYIWYDSLLYAVRFEMQDERYYVTFGALLADHEEGFEAIINLSKVALKCEKDFMKILIQHTLRIGILHH